MFGAPAPVTPESTDDTSAGHSNTTRWAVIGLVLALIAAGGWSALQIFGGDDSSAASADCEATTVTLVVAPAMADLVDAAVASLEDNGQCVELDVSTATAVEVAAAQDEVDEGEEDVLPDLWVPESPAWQTVLTGAGLTGKVLVPALAASPVGLASGSTRPAPATWLEALSSRRLVKLDPLASGAFAQTLLAPLAEAADAGGDVAAAQSALVPVAQKFGAKMAAGRNRPVTIDTIPVGSKRLIPVTEQDILIARRGNSALTWTTPRTGAAVLNFPLIQPDAGSGGISVGSGSLDVAGRTGEKIAAWFTSEEGIAAIAGVKLRAPDGTPLPDDESVSAPNLLPAAERSQVDATMKSWGILTVPSSVLAVIDASSSMDTVEGTSTRIGLAVGAAVTALDAFPDHARIGLWVFSIDQGGDGQDWREMAALRRLDAPTGDGGKQAELLRAQAEVLPRLTGGGTGTYDTVLAAYRAAAREYNPAYYNSVVLMTDGANDDPDSISLSQLLAELEALHDPDRPVRIIPVGISANADMESLNQIADATGGQAYEARDPQDILKVLASGLLSR
jgi:hypothetical protein